jgi:hypothetical protein
MFMMALMLFAIVVSYLLMFDLVKFAESVIDKALPSKITRRHSFGHKREREIPLFFLSPICSTR